MASSWIPTPQLRSSEDTSCSESHPGGLAHKRAGPFAVSAAQICLKIGEDGQPALPSDVAPDKRYAHIAPAVVTLQVNDGPPAPSAVHTNAFTTSPLPTQKQVARSQSPPSSFVFEQLLASFPTNSQSVAPISAASNSTPPLPPSALEARPVSTTDTSTVGSPTIGYSANQLLNQSPNLERGQTGRPMPRRSGTTRTFGTSAGGSIAQTEYTDMVFEPIPFRYNVLTCFCVWIVLAGFLVLPSSFPTIETLLNESSKLQKVVHITRNLPLLAIGYTLSGIGAFGLFLLWMRFSHNYIWLLSSIFIPGMFSGISSLISTFVNLYGPGNKVHYSASTIVTIAVAGGYAAICGFLTVVYTIKKHLAKNRHDRIERERSEGGEEIKEKLEV